MKKTRLPKSNKEEEANTNRRDEAPQTAVKSPLFPCYLCGRQYYVPAIYDHEEECLKIWQAENAKLPPHKRKKLPQKEDVKFTPSGEVDFVGTFNRIWENHLAELVPCERCGRTFAPDRIEVHEKVCKGEGIKKKKQGNSRKS